MHGLSATAELLVLLTACCQLRRSACTACLRHRDVKKHVFFALCFFVVLKRFFVFFFVFIVAITVDIQRVF